MSAACQVTSEIEAIRFRPLEYDVLGTAPGKDVERWKVGPGSARRPRSGLAVLDEYINESQSDDGEEWGELQGGIIPEEDLERGKRAGFDGGGRKARHGKRRRVARPRDAMPGFRRRRKGEMGRGWRGRKDRFRKGAGAQRVGKSHLDRGIGLSEYYGVQGNDDIDNEEGQDENLGFLNELRAGTSEDVDAPLCLGHGMPCKRFCVRKKGANKGRAFYKCAEQLRYKQCDYFIWEDELEANSEELSGEKSDLDARKREGRVAPPRLTDCDLDSALTKLTGFTTFREGQRKTIELLLGGRSTLAILPTGGGKSLCYLLPAALLPGTAVVVTPLLSLMVDQLASVPSALSGACLQSGQTRAEIRRVETRFLEGELKILFVSPERVLQNDFRALLENRETINTYRVSFFVIDEAHCMSEWSHNFRVAYLRLARSLKRFDRPILALTATSTIHVTESITSLLNIAPENVVRADLSRPNLELSVMDCNKTKEEKLNCLFKLLRRKEYTGHVTSANGTGSLIVYVATRRDCNLVTSIVRGSLTSLRVSTYHAGLSREDRQKLEQQFRNGLVDVVVATVAFGLGIDRTNVRGVIHWCLPSSLEAYAQEVGRAGRDGQPAWCTVLLTDEDKALIRSRAHADGVEVYAVRSFLRLLSEQILLGVKGHAGSGYETISAHLSHQKIMKEMDMSVATAETICGLLEGMVPGLHLAGSKFMTAKVRFFTESPARLASASSCERIPSYAQQLCSLIDSKARLRNGVYSLAISDVELSTEHVIQGLRSLKCAKHISYELADEALVVEVPSTIANVSAGQIAEASKALAGKLREAEKRRREKADLLIKTLTSATAQSSLTDQSSLIHHCLCTTFSLTSPASRTLSDQTSSQTVADEVTCHHQKGKAIGEAVESLAREQRDGRFISSARQAARILQGMSSPAFRAQDWHHSQHWGQFRALDFEFVKEIARSKLRDLRLCKRLSGDA